MLIFFLAEKKNLIKNVLSILSKPTILKPKKEFKPIEIKVKVKSDGEIKIKSVSIDLVYKKQFGQNEIELKFKSGHDKNIFSNNEKIDLNNKIINCFESLQIKGISYIIAMGKGADLTSGTNYGDLCDCLGGKDAQEPKNEKPFERLWNHIKNKKFFIQWKTENANISLTYQLKNEMPDGLTNDGQKIWNLPILNGLCFGGNIKILSDTCLPSTFFANCSLEQVQFAFATPNFSILLQLNTMSTFFKLDSSITNDFSLHFGISLFKLLRFFIKAVFEEIFSVILRKILRLVISFLEIFIYFNSKLEWTISFIILGSNKITINQRNDKDEKITTAYEMSFIK